VTGGGGELAARRCQFCHDKYKEPPCHSCKFRRVRLLGRNKPAVELLTLVVNSGIVRVNSAVSFVEIKSLAETFSLGGDTLRCFTVAVLPELVKLLQKSSQTNN
jgi:hypothetical protein